MKAFLLACALSALAIPAWAGDWPEHGYYQVVDRMDKGHRYCELRSELKVDGSIFALVIREYPSGSLMVQFLTQGVNIDQTRQVIIALDGKEVLRFNPTIRDDSPELPSVAAFIGVEEGEAIIQQLSDTAKGAQWLQVVALPYLKKIPADGLKEAVEDLAASRTARKV